MSWTYERIDPPDDEEPADEDCVCEEPEIDEDDVDFDAELDKRYEQLEARCTYQ